MITEDYVSFETAKLLKDKGFKEWCYKCYGTAVYHKGVPISFDEECELKDEGLKDEIEYVEGGYLYDIGCGNRKEDANVWAAPTLWVAIKWLMKNYGIHITAVPNGIGKNVFYMGIYKKYDDYGWIYISDGLDKKFKEAEFYTPEEACEAAIKYCLENLI